MLAVVAVTGDNYNLITDFVSTDKKQKNDSFSVRLRAAMREHDLTQKSLGNAVGVAQSAVFNWLHGSFPGSAELYRISQVLNKPMDWFFDGIPFQKDEHSLRIPIANAPADTIPPEIRPDVINMYELADLASQFAQLAQTSFAPARKRPLNKNKPMVDIGPAFCQSPDVKEIRSLSELLDAVRRLTKARGKKVELARFIGVTRQAVDRWLSGKPNAAKPSAETTFALLNWVRKQNG